MDSKHIITMLEAIIADKRKAEGDLADAKRKVADLEGELKEIDAMWQSLMNVPQIADIWQDWNN